MDAFCAVQAVGDAFFGLLTVLFWVGVVYVGFAFAEIIYNKIRRIRVPGGSGKSRAQDPPKS